MAKRFRASVQGPFLIMVVFEVTQQIESCLDIAGVGKSTRLCDGSPANLHTVEHSVLISAFISAGKKADWAEFRKLIDGSAVHRSHDEACRVHAPPPKRNPELVARLAILKAKADEKEYAAMVRDVAGSGATNAQMEYARLGRIGAQMSIGANVIVTMITCFVAGYFVFKASSGRESVGLAGGIAGLIIAMAVEATLVITRMYSIETAADKEFNRKSRELTASVRRAAESSIG